MNNIKYRKLESTLIRSTCVLCKKNPQKKKKDRYQALCSTCDRRLWGAKSYAKRKLKAYRPYTLIHTKTKQCTLCTFIAEDLCQMDIDHINGDNTDHRPDNLQTLCANCHRLKTKLNKDGAYARRT